MKQSSKEKNRFPQFRERFRELQGDMSNTEFAELLGMSRQTVGFYCNGDRIPDALTIKEIAQKCNVSTDWLLGLSDFRSKEEYYQAGKLYTEFMRLMASTFDGGDREHIVTYLIEIIQGFLYFHNNCVIGYTPYDNIVKMISGVLLSTAECVKAVENYDLAEINTRVVTDDIFQRIVHIIDTASTAVYKEFGIYFNYIKRSIKKSLEADEYRETNYVFREEANKLLAESDAEFDDYIETEVERMAKERSNGGSENI